jgi:hypothetical protein
MIALASRLPLLRIGACDRSDYDPDWLEEQIRAAATSAGHERWWFAEDMARSVFVYLEDRFQDQVITLQQLSLKVKGVLEHLGFRDIAGELAIKPPPWTIDLAALALRAGAGYELLFYKTLETELRLGIESKAELMSITGLRAAVKTLCGARRWQTRCEQTQRELAEFIKRRIESGDIRRFCLC